jgi:glycosyltransferase involved in cell wall biosynthesis
VATIMPIKVAILLPSLDIGGAERLVLEELRVLSLNKQFYFEVHLVFEGGHLYQKLLELNITNHVWHAQHNPFSMLWTYWRIAVYLRKQRFTVLHCHLVYKIGVWVGVLARLSKIITTIHTARPLSRMDKAALNRSHLVLACGARVAEHLKCLAYPQRIKVLSNAICNPKRDIRLRIEAEKIYGLEKDQKIILSIGHLVYDKGYDILIEAFRVVSKKHPRALLLIAGEGPESARLNKQIRDASLQSSVRLLGLIRDAAPLYERADIYINSSRREGLPLTLLEASAYAKPIIATDVGGNNEIVINGITGLLVGQCNLDALAQALFCLLNNEKEAGQLARHAHELFKSDYQIEEHTQKLTLEYLV